MGNLESPGLLVYRAPPGNPIDLLKTYSFVSLFALFIYMHALKHDFRICLRLLLYSQIFFPLLLFPSLNMSVLILGFFALTPSNSPDTYLLPSGSTFFSVSYEIRNIIITILRDNHGHNTKYNEIKQKLACWNQTISAEEKVPKKRQKKYMQKET